MEKLDLEPYRALAEAGPLAVAEEAKRRGLSTLRIIYVLHKICDMDVGDAKEFAMSADPNAQEFHDRLMTDLDEVHAEMDRENGTS